MLCNTNERQGKRIKPMHNRISRLPNPCHRIAELSPLRISRFDNLTNGKPF